MMSDRPTDRPLSVLFICNKSPWPAREGGPIAMNNLIEGLSDAGHLVKVLAINTNKYAVDPKDIPEDYRAKTDIELGYIDLSIKPFDAFLNLFTGRSYHVERFINKTFERKLKEILAAQCFDIIQIETLFMSPYLNVIREMSNARVVLRAHNIEHLIWRRVADITRNPLKVYYLRHLANTLEKYEKQVLDQYDGIVPISPVDEPFFKSNSHKPVLSLPTGIDPQRLPATNRWPDTIDLFHIGAMNWMPNEEGISWFLEKVWPLVSTEHPHLKLHLAGRHMPRWLTSLNRPQVVIHGEVDDAYDFMSNHAILIAPLFSGSGIRIKIIESMALGRAVIATTIGAEGINFTDGTNIRIADDEQAFARAIGELTGKPDRARQMGAEARRLIMEEHNTPKIIEHLTDFYQHIL